MDNFVRMESEKSKLQIAIQAQKVKSVGRERCSISPLRRRYVKIALGIDERSFVSSFF